MRLIETSFFRKNKEIAIISAAGIFFNLLSLFLVGYKSGIITFISLNQRRWDFFYLLYFISFTVLFGIILFFAEKKGWKNLFGTVSLAFLPTQIAYLFAIEKKIGFNEYFGIMTALYFVAVASFLLTGTSTPEKPNTKTSKPEKKSWISILIILLVLIAHLYFGIHNIGKMAIVDEPLWTFDRIPDFWKNVGNQNWYNSRVSDKPGLTTAVISGAGLLLEKNPKQLENIKWEGEIFNINAAKMEGFNTIFRLPIFVFEALLLPFFYFFLKKLFNRKVALFSFVFIALSPILLGNSRIINPDSSLWLFTSFSLITYLIYFKEQSKKYLFLAAFFLTLSVLTKYVANFLYIFFFLFIFIEFIFNQQKYSSINFQKYIRNSFLNYGLLVILSLLLFYVLYPACWGKPSRVLIGTIYSQAFIGIWPYFAGIIIFTLADMLLLRAKILSLIINSLSRHANIMYRIVLMFFMLSITLTWLNVSTGMSIFDAEKILSSPKSSSSVTSLWHIYLANFYPLIFGISPVLLLSLIAFVVKDFFSKNKSVYHFAVLAILLFIFLYYAGSVLSGVSLTIRYQIIIYPLIFILAGIATTELLSLKIISRYSNNLTAASLALVAILFFSLANSSPFFMGYASGLLPKKYSIDLKGMGEGSYEAAQYLNSLADANSLSIWSDKQGVCVFFVGRCHTSLSKKFFEQNSVNYYVASSDRATRTINMIENRVAPFADIHALYSADGIAEKTIYIDGRSSNFVKIVRGEKIEK